MRTRPRKPRLALGALATALVAGTLAPAGAAPGTTVRASERPTTQANGHSPATSVTDTTSPQLSLDGRSVAFSSDATNLVSGDTNRVSDVFVRLPTGTVARASVSNAGRQANGPSHSPAISVDGRYVAFVSEATNLVAGDTNGVADVFLRDRARQRTTRVSVATGGVQANGASSSPSISLFGRYVTFESAAANLAAGDTNALADAFVHDTTTRATGRLMPPTDQGLQTVPLTEAPDPTAVLRRDWTASPSISYDGRYVAFVRGTYERGPAVPSALEIFVRDRRARTYTKVDIKPWMGGARVLADNPVISADGRYVAFEAWSILDSVAGSDEALIRNPLDVKDVFVYDRISSSIGQVSVNSFFQAGNADSYAPSISAGGQYIAFSSDASNLVPGDTNAAPDVFVRDNVARTTSRMSIAEGSAQAAAGGTRPSISYEGRNVAFASSSPLVSGDTNGRSDVFRRDRQTDTQNSAPSLAALPKRTIANMQESQLVLRATDPNRDALRYGILTVTHQGSEPVTANSPPQGSSLHPTTGLFRWTPTPNQAGSWRFIFWVADPRGAVDYRVWDVVVRSIDQTAGCTLQGC